MFSAVGALALVVLSQSNPALEAAQKAVAELRYPEARGLLAKARTTAALDRASLLEILWLQGLVSVSLGQAESARTAFRTLLSIEPEYTPSKEQPPKVMGPFYEARGWAATKAPLRLTALPPERRGGRVKRIGIKVSADPLSLIVAVRFHVLGADDSHADVVQLSSTRDVDGEDVRWWAELIGERDAQLEVLGSAEAPLVARGADLLPEAPPPPPPLEVSQPPPGRPPLRAAAYISLGISAAALVVGCVFAALAGSLTGQLKGVQRDSSGAVTGLTQRQAFALDSQERTDAFLGNTLLGAGGALAVMAILLFLGGGGS